MPSSISAPNGAHPSSNAVPNGTSPHSLLNGQHQQQSGAAPSTTPLAVIGWSNRFPGDATTPEGFWDMLCQARTAHGRIPEDRFNVDAFYHPDSDRSGSVSVTSAHFLKQKLGAFDAPFFSIQPSEAASMDPQQRLLLETAYHAFEHAGLSIDSVKASKTSVYVGSSAHDYESIYARDPENAPKYLGTGIGGSIIPNRVSWFYDLRGESMLVDTACSSTLSCLHLAAQGLKSGESDMALVSGVNLMIAPDSSFFHLSNMGFFSPDGRSYSFDCRANGYAKGEGTAVLLLKRLDDAVRDGNTIRAVLRATSTNQDGRTPGITQPSPAAQEANIRSIYHRHSLDPALTKYVEAHGTGTQVGDPIESSAIAKAFHRDASNPLTVGAVKTNIGHLEAVAGLAGLIKTVMVLEKGLIPPNALYKAPNERIPIDEWNLRFPTELTPWPTRGLRRASVNSFGYGGTNTHAVLDDAYHFLKEHNITANHNTVEYPALPRAPAAAVNGNGVNGASRPESSVSSKVFVWSAAEEAGVKRIVESYANYLDALQPTVNEQDFLRNLSHTLSNKRSMLPWKTFVAADSLQSLKDGLASRSSKPVRSTDPPTLAFVFTGQGAQWHAMGRELACYPVFQQSLDRSESVLHGLGCGFSLKEELAKDKASSRVNEPLMSQSLCTALQLALVDLLASWGIVPKAVVGHSSGEIAAAYCAGGLDFVSAIKASYFRGHHATELVRSKARDGSMISVSLSPEAVMPHLRDAMAAGSGKLVVGCENSPTNVTVSGDRACVEHLNSMMEEQGTFARQLKVPLAYHSPHMDLIADGYRESLAGIAKREESYAEALRDNLPIMFSSVTGKQIDPDSLAAPDYWVKNAVSTVKFSPALKSLTQSLYAKADLAGTTCRLLTLEVGPHSALKRPSKETVAAVPQAKNALYESLLERDSSAVSSCQEAIARMRCSGCQIDLNKVNYPTAQPADFKLLVNLPQYPFNHSQVYWAEPRMSKNYRFRPVARHELLGVPSTDWNSLEPHWRHFLKLAENPWMQDHHMDSANLYPGAGMVVMAIEAARQLASFTHTVTGYRLKNLQFIQGLKVNDSAEGVEVQLRFHRPNGIGGGSSLEHDFALFMYADGQWTQCCCGNITTEVAGEGDSPSDTFRRSYEMATLHAQHEATRKSCAETISTKEFYANMAKFGFGFGPSHQSLEDIRYKKNAKEAVGTMVLDGWMSKCQMPKGTPSAHVIHPTALDGIAQLTMACFSQAGFEPIPTMVPTDCKSIWVSNDLLTRKPGAKLVATSRTTFSGFREADFTITAFDEAHVPQLIIQDWRQMAVTNIGSFQSGDADPRRLFYNLKWDADVEQLPPTAVQSLCETRALRQAPETFDYNVLELVSMYYTSTVLQRVDSGEKLAGFGSHTSKYFDWARRCFSESRFRELARAVPNGEKLFDDSAREQYLDSLAATNVECALTIDVGRNLGILLNGEANPVEVVYNHALIRDFYVGPSFTRSFEQIKAYVELAGHKNPNLSILEVGAGTGSGTVALMDALAPKTAGGARPKLPSFERYDFTDLSPQFFEHARGAFSDYSNRFNFATLDIEKDPLGQGFTEGSYDVIYAGLVLHATADISASLRHARRLLKPNGKLIMLELTNLDCARVHFIFGLLYGWWLGTEEVRKNGPLLTESGWDTVLKQSGFKGAEISMSDADDSSKGLSQVIVATADDASVGSAPPAINSIVVADASSAVQQDLAKRVSSLLGASNPTKIISSSEMESVSFSNAHCIVLKELEKPWLKTIDASDFKNVQKLIGEASSILWVTTGTGVLPTTPDHELVTGLGRNARSENWTMNFTHLGLESLGNAEIVAESVHAIHTRISTNPVERCEDVYKEKDGKLFVARIHEYDDLNVRVSTRTTQQKQEETTLAKEADRPLMLSIGAPGLLDTMHFIDDKSPAAPLADTDVEVRPAAIGLNFRDVLIALGRMSSKAFGYEFSGTVLRAGARTEFKAGDRVMGLTTTGAIKTQLRAHASSVAKIDDDLSFEQAAAMPMTFATAYYCLISKADLQEGESVLIHSAAGGVGQAAIQVAKHLGARIFATVGSDEKKKFLMETYGLPEDHIFSSRTAEFADSVMKLTGGSGADVVLNSLSGDLMRASWSSIATMGRFVEIGKTDIMSTRGLPTKQFLKSVSFMGVDLAVVMDHSARAMSKVMKGLMELHRSGVLEVSKPLRVYGIDDIEGAFRSMQGGKNMGKAVITMDENATVPAIPSSKPTYYFNSDATYVIAGGFGGIGGAFVKWMASRGARNFLIVSRSGDQSAAARKLIADLAPDGVRIVGPRCDIADEAQVEALVKQAARDMPPIKGCIQATMVLRDGLFTNMTHDDWTQSIRPKVMGSWNLNKHLPKGMDFFVPMSSIASITGSRGQANYAAGNAFKDAIVRYRLSQGERAFDLNIGPILSVGLVAEQDISENLLADGFEAIEVTELLALLEHACDPAHGRPGQPADSCQIVTGLGGVRDPRSKQKGEVYWLQRNLFSALRNYDAEVGADGADGNAGNESAMDVGAMLKDNASSPPAAINVILTALMMKLSRALNIPLEDVESSKPIHAFGVDSLVSLEIRYWLMKEIKANLAVFDIMGAATLNSLCALTWQKSGYNPGTEEKA